MSGDFLKIMVDNKSAIMITPQRIMHSIDLELPCRGYGPNDLFMATVYFGDQIDMSQLFNGHSPSRIMNAGTFKPSDVWTHVCVGGIESFRKLEVRQEKETWIAFLLWWKKIFALTAKYHDDFTTPVMEIQKKLQDDQKLNTMLYNIREFVGFIAENIKNFELFKAVEFNNSEIARIGKLSEI